MTVLHMLQSQITSDPAPDAGADWYNQVKALQVLATEAINNQDVFAS